jgi:hypothetical protein
MNNVKGWAERARLNRNGEHRWYCGEYREQLYEVSNMRIHDVQQTVHVQGMVYQMGTTYRMDEWMGDFADLWLCVHRRKYKDSQHDDVRAYRTIHSPYIRIICTPGQGHRLRGRPNNNLRQWLDDIEYGRINKRTRDRPTDETYMKYQMTAIRPTEKNIGRMETCQRSTKDQQSNQYELLMEEMNRPWHANSFWNHKRRNKWHKGITHGWGEHPTQGLYRTEWVQNVERRAGWSVSSRGKSLGGSQERSLRA